MSKNLQRLCFAAAASLCTSACVETPPQTYNGAASNAPITWPSAPPLEYPSAPPFEYPDAVPPPYYGGDDGYYYPQPVIIVNPYHCARVLCVGNQGFKPDQPPYPNQQPFNGPQGNRVQYNAPQFNRPQLLSRAPKPVNRPAQQ